MIITPRQLILTHEEFTQLAERMYQASLFEEQRFNPFFPRPADIAQEKYRRMAGVALGFFNNLLPEAEHSHDTTKNTA